MTNRDIPSRSPFGQLCKFQEQTAGAVVVVAILPAPAPPSAPVFLVVDFHAESRYLLSRTLRRKFPGAVIHECDEAAPALVVLQKEPVSAVISHRTFEHSGAELVKMFRTLKPGVPIVMVSGTDRAQLAREAGASLFLHYDEWLRLGTVVQGLMATPSHDRRTVA